MQSYLSRIDVKHPNFDGRAEWVHTCSITTACTHMYTHEHTHTYTHIHTHTHNFCEPWRTLIQLVMEQVWQELLCQRHMVLLRRLQQLLWVL